LERGTNLSKLGSATDDSRIQSPRECVASFNHPQEPVRPDRLRLPLEGKRFNRLRLDGAAGEFPGEVTDQDLPWARHLFKPGRDIHSVACGEPANPASHDLASVHPYPELQRHPIVALQLL